MNIVLIILLVLYVIAFLVIIWKSAAIWRWHQLVLAIAVMTLAIIFLAPLAGVLKTRTAWNQMFQNVEQQLEQQKTQYQQLTESDDSVPAMRLELQKLSSETGRVWRHLQMQDVTPQGITLVRAAPQDPGMDPALGGAEEPPPAAPNAVPLIPATSIVYGFAEQNMTFDENTWSTPTVYLGEFTVVSSTPTQAVILATNPPTERQRRAIESGAASQWSLYEMLPLDGHAPFLAEGSVPSDTNMFGRVDTELLETLFADRLLPETKDAYLKDGQRAGEGSEMVQTTEAAADPDGSEDTATTLAGQVRNEQLTLWSKIKFTAPFSDTVDSTENREAKDGGFFELGLAVDSRLKRIEGPVVQLKAGDEIYVTFEVATRLRDQGVADILANYHVRDLNDYRFVLRRTDLRIDEVQDRIAQLTQQQKLLEDTMAMTDAMNQKYQVDKNLLEADSEQIIKERAAIASYTAQLEEELKSTKQTLTTLYQSNLLLNQQLIAIHKKLTQQIDERTRAATP